MENIITCKNLTHAYGKRVIYKNLSFSVPKGQITGLLGKNGTGKTTTINILNGYLQPLEGHCTIFGENVQALSPQARSKIGLLLEGHVQYSYMNIAQLEKFYASFYPRWRKEPYYELMNKIRIAPRQRLNTMSCGQRSQVALGIILAQDPELLILDDFSMGLDPGYRRLFVDYLKEYAKAENKTIFVTSHIIQDMERLIDECIIMDYGQILLQEKVDNLLNSFQKFSATMESSDMPKLNNGFYHPEVIKGTLETYGFMSKQQANESLRSQGVNFNNLKAEKLTLEDAFIGLTGKY